MTKAERIFTDTRRMCKQHIRNFGYQINPDGISVGYNTVSYNDNETICTRTLNDITKCIERDRKKIELWYKHEVIAEDEYTFDTQVLNMVASTVRNNRESLRRFDEMQKA